MEKAKSKRLLSVDVMRGLTVAGMILVNNPGSWSHIYAPLRHAEWNGLTPTDLVFPFFMFIMGVSMCLSLGRRGMTLNYASLMKIIKRFVVIFLLGLLLGWFGTFCGRLAWDAPDGETLPLWARLINAANSFDTIRVLGVLPRLAICYLVAALIVMTVKRRAVMWITGLLLVAYTIIILLGYGFEFSDSNVISIVDHKMLGENHMYHDTVGGTRLAFDPEGLLSTLPSIAHVLIGYCCGLVLASGERTADKALRLFVVGTVLTFAGFLLSYGLPINKKIWSPTFVLTTCGLASSLLALLTWIIDIRGTRRVWRPAEVFGVNPLALYVLSGVLAILLGTVSIGGQSIGGLYYNGVLRPLIPSPEAASLAFALSFVALNWLIGYILYRRHIYIKI